MKAQVGNKSQAHMIFSSLAYLCSLPQWLAKIVED
jgi:hypothetical protein